MPNPISLMTIRNQVRPSGRLWNPPADVYRCEEGWMVKVDLAGVSVNDVEIILSDTYLIIRGCRRDTFIREGYTYQQMEITYSRFEKRVEFPCSINSASLSQEYSDGFLIVSVRCK